MHEKKKSIYLNFLFVCVKDDHAYIKDRRKMSGFDLQSVLKKVRAFGAPVVSLLDLLGDCFRVSGDL